MNSKYDASNPDNFISKSDLSATSPIAYNNGIISVASGYQIPTTAQMGLINNAIQPNDNISELTNDSGYITGITSSDVTTALGYTPYNSTNPSGYQTSTQVSSAVSTHNSSSSAHSSLFSTKENTSNKVTSISSSSTDTQYPTAKCMWDIIGNLEGVINALWV